MRFFETTASIEATPERIWGLLTDAAAYPAWNPTVDRVEGTIAPGERLDVVAKLNPGRAFAVRVTEFEPPRRMVWSGGMPAGLFRGVRTFTLTPAGDATRFHMREEYTGPLLRIIWRSMPDLGQSFSEFAAGLKTRAEQRT